MINKPSIEAINKFDNSLIGKTKNAYLKKAKITGILAIMFGIVWTILNIYYKLNWYDYVTAILLILFGIYFILNSKRIKYQEVNKFINEEQKKSSN